MRCTDKGHPYRDQPPGDHDACDPAPCTPTLHDQGAGNFQNDVAEGEDARPEPDYAIVEAEIVRHLQGRGGKIVAIKVSNYVKQEHIRQKMQGDTAAGAAANVSDGIQFGHMLLLVIWHAIPGWWKMLWSGQHTALWPWRGKCGWHDDDASILGKVDADMIRTVHVNEVKLVHPRYLMNST